uniref:cytochrome c biogenesis protein transmembrane region n=1 Tax=Rhodospora sordida TaxID=362230 RepID=UPI001FCDA3B2|nr:cytochrome c biogenesis protein transmembrane region [Rhodospora sordida]UNJ14999.1 cytochrome c biogenesis protein transmembrane region [Rhodospora sordida]
MMDIVFSSQNFSLQISIVFIAGIINSLNPCSVGVLPMILYSLEDIKPVRQYAKWLVFSLGLYSSFLLFFLLQKELNIYLANIAISESICRPIIFLILGFLTLEIIPAIVYFNPLNWIASIKEERYLLISYAIGIGLGLTVSSCTTPILFVLFTWLSTQNNVLKEIFFGGIYSVGYAFPFLFIITLFKGLSTILKQKKWNKSLSSIIGIFFISIGVSDMLSNFLSLV